MTNTKDPIKRFMIGYPTPSGGERSSIPGSIPDPEGGWVRYEDHVAFLKSNSENIATKNKYQEEFTVSSYPPSPVKGFNVGMSKGVKITHNPTGLFATCDSQRSQHSNRDIAMNALKTKVAQHLLQNQQTVNLHQILTDPKNQPNQYGVKFFVRVNKFTFQIGNRAFTLDYEPEDEEEFLFMRNALISAFSVFVPGAVSKPEEKKHEPTVVLTKGEESNMTTQAVLSDEEIDRIVPALEEPSDVTTEEHSAEWALWKDRTRIRRELREARGQVTVVNPSDTKYGPEGAWYCENHPDQLMNHHDCKGAGIPANARISMLMNQLRLSKQEVRETRQMRDQLAATLRELHKEKLSFPGMTAEEYAALPKAARDYIHQIETNADPAGMVRENMQLRDTNEALEKMYRNVVDGQAPALAAPKVQRYRPGIGEMVENDTGRYVTYDDYLAATTAQAAPAAEPDKADPRKLRLQNLVFSLARLSCVPPMAPALEHQLDRLIEFYFDNGEEKFARSLVQLKRSARSEGRRSVLVPSAPAAGAVAETSCTQPTKGINMIHPDVFKAYCDAWKESFKKDNPFHDVELDDDLKKHITAGLVAAIAAQKDSARYQWLREQFWIESEATFRLGLEETDDSSVFQKQLDAAIDERLKP